MSDSLKEVRGEAHTVDRADRRLWRFLMGLWMMTATLLWLVDWPYGAALVLLATFVHLAATEGSSEENR